MDPLAAIRVTFFQECDEQLAELEGGLLAVEEGDHDPERINAVFRAVHSIKGGAGAFGLEPLVRFAHVFETALDRMRSGGLAPEDNVLKVMLRAADVLADHVAAARDGSAVDEGRSALLADELAQLTGEPAEPDEGGDLDIAFQPLGFDLGLPGAELPDLTAFPDLPELPDLPDLPDLLVASAPSQWLVRLKPFADLYGHGNETGLLLRELGRLGDLELTLDADALPTLDALIPTEGYLSWSAILTTDAGEEAVREVFDFVEGHCELDVRAADAIEPPDPGGLELADLETPQPHSADVDLQAPGVEAPAEVDIGALIRQAQSAVHDMLTDDPPPPAPADTSPPTRVRVQQQIQTQSSQAPAPAATIRVDLERVDRLIDLVGELVINQAVLAQRAAESGLARQTDVAMGLDDLEQLTREIQDSVMAIRAQPVKSVFQRMPRLVREVASVVHKDVRLVTEGENTEVDKTVIERLSDPITHMIRNAIDHGLETAEKRIAAGKPAEGVVRLAAFHRSGRIVIEVSDDGAGINRSRVREIAVDKGLIDPNVQLSDEEIDNLIFLPGFSTASAISDISGRGVGMDVVKRSIGSLGGRIAITSIPGKGSTFTMSLPLTLAVLDGMVVSAAGQTLIAPLSAIVETLQPKSSDVKPIGANAWVMAIRDSFVPMIDVGLALGYRAQPADPTDCVALLVEGEGATRAALLVDAIQGQRQVVIKSLEANYRHVPGIAAATILGDGRVALILDVDTIVSRRSDLPPGAAPFPAESAAA